MFSTLFLLVSALAIIGLIVIVYSRSSDNLSTRLFILMLILVIGYLSSHAVHFLIMAQGDLTILDKSCHSFLILIMLTLTLFSFSYPDKKELDRSLLSLFVIPAVIILIFLWAGYFVIESEGMGMEFLPRYSGFYPVVIIWYLGMMLINVIVLTRKFQKEHQHKNKMQILLLLIGLIVTNFTTFFVGMFLPWISGVYYLIEISPLAFLLGVVLFTAAGISKYDMFPMQLKTLRNFGINKKVLLVALILIPIIILLVQIPLGKILFDIDIQQSTSLFIMSLLGSILVSISMAVLINLIISAPLQELKINAIQIKEGNFNTRTHIKTNDEFGDLAETFNNMAEALEEKELIKEKLKESEKLAALGEMAAILAHEIKTPLTSIKLNADILNETLELDQNDKKAFEIMQKEISRLSMLVKEVLQFSREAPLMIEVFNVKDLVEESLFQLKQRIKNKQINVKIDLSEIDIKADREKIKQVILNLLENAVDAVKECGEIAIRGVSEKSRIKISIKNNGDTIKEKEKLFQPFFTTKASGTGLGLVISRNIIEQHGGNLTFTETTNMETIFSIELPKEK